jgi:hypothetical protein
MSEIELDLGYEYLAANAPSYAPRNEELTEWLNDKAGDGWRLISVNASQYFFERKARKLRMSPSKSDNPNP